MTKNETVDAVLQAYFLDTAYSIMQHAIGVTDGGFASHYDSDTTGPYESKFGNGIGGRILETVKEEVGHVGLVAGAHKLTIDVAELDAWTPSPQAIPEGDLRSVALRAADKLVEVVTLAYPHADELVALLRDRVTAFYREYAEAEAAFNADATPAMAP